MSGDMPHLCATNTATSKEIWVEPVNRFLGAVSIYATDGIIPYPGKAGADEEENGLVDAIYAEKMKHK